MGGCAILSSFRLHGESELHITNFDYLYWYSSKKNKTKRIKPTRTELHKERLLERCEAHPRSHNPRASIHDNAES